MTPFGLATLLAGVASLVLGVTLGWLAFSVLGVGMLVAVLVGLITVARPSRLAVDREIQPPRVPKGSPAIAYLTFTNRGYRSVPATVATQPFGSMRVRTVIPRLHGGETGSRAYRLPTRERGIFDVEPLELTRRDAFEMFRRTRRHADVARIWVYPRVLDFRPLPTGHTRYLEGPSSETSPQGTITFHRLREYVPGDDLRLVHWRSSAKAGSLLVKHNVDTSQPFTVVVLDQRPDRYTDETFEQAVDVAASAVVAANRDGAPVELRLTDGIVVGGPREREATPLIDHLTGVRRDPAGSLRSELIALRRSRGGTSLVVVTGTLDGSDIGDVAALRRRFERLVLVCLDDSAAADAPSGATTGGGKANRASRAALGELRGVRVITAATADETRDAWNLLGQP